MKQNGFTLNELAIALVILMVVSFVLTGWVKNIVKFSNCDFEAPYKAEIIHGVGLFPAIGAVTGWMNVGK